MYESLEQEDLTGKLVFVHPSHGARHMAVRSIHFDGMFMEEKMNHLQKAPLVLIC